MLHGRRYNEGLHQAIEAKEGVRSARSTRRSRRSRSRTTSASTTSSAGMTGTAMTEASEFDKIYRLGVVTHPDQPADDPRRPADLVYRTEDAKYAAVVDDIAERHAEASRS